MTVFVKDPGSTGRPVLIDYMVDWSDWLSASETISASTFYTNSTGISVSSVSNSTDTATVWLQGGTHGTVYRVTNKITTNQSRQDERHIVVRVEDR